MPGFYLYKKKKKKKGVTVRGEITLKLTKGLGLT